MDSFINNLPQLSGYAAVALIFWKCMILALEAHRCAMKEQREDLLSHMRTTCLSRREPGDIRSTDPRPPVLPLLLLSLLFIGGCQGQGGQVAGFNLTTPIGNLTWNTWTVVPAGSQVVAVTNPQTTTTTTTTSPTAATMSAPSTRPAN